MCSNTNKTGISTENVLKNLKTAEKAKLAALMSSCDHEGFVQYLRSGLGLDLSPKDQQIIWDTLSQKFAGVSNQNQSGATFDVISCKHSLELIPEECEMTIFQSTASNTGDNNDEAKKEKCNNGKKWFSRLVSRRRGEQVIDEHLGQSGKINDSLSSLPSTRTRSAARNSIVCEKSETYVVRLKPPANELLIVVVDNDNNCKGYKHHQCGREHEEDVLIWV